MRLVIARCQVDYVGRLQAHLPMAPRLILIKADGSVSIHADDRAYKPLNWMTPPCLLTEQPVPDDEKTAAVDVELDLNLPAAAPKIIPPGEVTGRRLWVVENKKGEQLRITIDEIIADQVFELGVDPGLIKDGVEAHLQELLAEHIETLGIGYSLIRREYPTAIGPVDILCRDDAGTTVAVEIKRRGEIDGVEQLSRYLELLNRDELLAPVAGVFAAQEIKPQAKTLAEDRGIRCVTLDYDSLRGIESQELRLF